MNVREKGAGHYAGTMSRLFFLSAFTALTATPAHAIIGQDSVGTEALIDFDNEYSNVALLFRLDGFVCSGTLINPRTVITASHCFADLGSEAFGGTGIGVATIFDPLAGRSPGPLAAFFASDVIIPVEGNNPAAFPDADVSLVALSQPVGNVQASPILLSPVGQTIVTLVGYGRTGVGSTGVTGPESVLDLVRRSGDNSLDFSGSLDDLAVGFGLGDNFFGTDQTLYHYDFDPDDRVDLFDPHASDFDPLPGDAIANEVTQGGGDSGGPWFVTIGGQRYVSAVHSGGLPLFGPTDTYGEISFGNPLFPFADFIAANNPYKYVSAVPGDGSWTDPDHWQQDLDPAYFILDETGQPVNGLPEAPAEDF